jgi:phosphoglycolate phosphatase
MFDHAHAFLFDFDGTLIQQRIDFARMRRVVLETAASYGVASEPPAGMFVLELISRVEAELARHNRNRGQAFAAAAQRAVADIELEAAESATAFPGVPEMLQGLRARGFGTAIVTRNCRAAVERVLARNPMPYDVLLTRDDVPHAKPDPRHLLAALQALALLGPQVVMCGDHPTDVAVGQRIGAATVGVLPVGAAEGYFDEVHPDLVVPRVTDLLLYCPVACRP